jgi:ubiquitin-conjugating enzyme E2 M
MPPKKAATGPTGPSTGAPKLKAHELRLRKEFAEGMADLPPQISTLIPDANNISHFKITVDLKGNQNDKSYWYKGKYTFNVETPKEYPHKPPKVTLDTPIYHPNIDRNGAVCLNILRKDWMPINTMNMVALGCLFLFNEPEPEDPLNHEAAAMMRD